MNTKAEQFFSALKQAVENDDLVLPTLPEVALKIRDKVEDADASAQQIAEVLKQDASLSARLLQVANSPVYQGMSKVVEIQTAITRLGLTQVRDMVVRLAMKQLFQATSDMMETRFRRIWNTAVEVAAICRMLAVTVKGINPEQALLAGLVHNIGALPILMMAESDDKLFDDSDALGQLIYELQGPVGEMILQSWNFPETMTELVANAYNFNYTHEGKANLVDIVQFALLQGNFVPPQYVPDDWQQIAAFSKLDMDAEVNVVEIEENQQQIELTKQSLQI